jgi:hypothetical protein
MPRISEAKRAAILADYAAAKMTVAAICRKHGVSDDQPRLIAKAAGVWRSTRAWRGRKRAFVALKRRPPKIDPEEWAARCAKRARYLAEVGLYPERALHPERYGGSSVKRMAALEGTFSPHAPGSKILAVLKAREQSDYMRRGG